MVDNTSVDTFYLIIAFFTSVILFLLNEWAKRRYLIHEKLLSLRLERFELLLQELYSYAEIYLDVKMILQIQTVDLSIETKAKIITVNQFLENLFSKSIINENEVWDAETLEKLNEQKWKIMNFLQSEGSKIFNDIQYKASNLHLIMPDKTIQSKANEIATNISTYISEADESKDYSDEITDEIKNLSGSMRKYLPSLSLTDFNIYFSEKSTIKTKLTSIKDTIEDMIKNTYYSIIRNIIFAVLLITLAYLLIGFFSNELKSEDILNITQSGAIVTATLALLTFSYASVLTEKNNEKEDLTEIGKYFLKSTLNFIIGMMFLIGTGFSKPKTNTFGIPETVYNFFNIYVPILIFFIAIMALIFSIVYFTKGILNFLKFLK